MTTSHRSFADQYRTAGLSPGGDIVKIRQEAFDKLRGSVHTGQIIDLTRLYFALPLRAGADWFRDGFAEADKSFSLVDNAREAAFLSYALLNAALEDGKVLAGLVPVTAAAGQTRTPVICSEFLTEAREKLSHSAIEARKHTGPNSAAIRVPGKSNITAAADQLAQAGDWPKAAELFKTIANTSADGLTDLAKQVQGLLPPLTAELNELREEADMLWWYVGGWSRVFERPFSEFTPALMAVLAGFDLARLVRTTLGPASAPAILHKLMQGATQQQPSAQVTIQDAVDAVAQEDIVRLQLNGKLNVVPDLCPVLAAFAKAEEIGGSPNWHAAFRKRSGLDASTPFSLLELSVQVYRESLVIKHLV